MPGNWQDYQEDPAFILFYPLDHPRCKESHFYLRTPPHCVLVMVDGVSPCLCADPDLCATTLPTAKPTTTTSTTTSKTTSTTISKTTSTTTSTTTTLNTTRRDTTASESKTATRHDQTGSQTKTATTSTKENEGSTTLLLSTTSQTSNASSTEAKFPWPGTTLNPNINATNITSAIQSTFWMTTPYNMSLNWSDWTTSYFATGESTSELISSTEPKSVSKQTTTGELRSTTEPESTTKKSAIEEFRSTAEPESTSKQATIENFGSSSDSDPYKQPAMIKATTVAADQTMRLSTVPAGVNTATPTYEIKETDVTLPGAFPFSLDNIVTSKQTTKITTQNPTRTTSAEISLAKVPWHKQVAQRELFPVEMMLAVVCVVLFMILAYLQYRIRRVKKRGLYSTLQPTTFLPLVTNRGTQPSKTGVNITIDPSHDYTKMLPMIANESNTHFTQNPYSTGLGNDSDYVAGSQRPVSILSAGYASSKHTKVHYSHVDFADGDKRINTERPPYTDTEISDYYPSVTSLDSIKEEQIMEPKELADKETVTESEQLKSAEDKGTIYESVPLSGAASMGDEKLNKTVKGDNSSNAEKQPIRMSTDIHTANELSSLTKKPIKPDTSTTSKNKPKKAASKPSQKPKPTTKTKPVSKPPSKLKSPAQASKHSANRLANMRKSSTTNSTHTFRPYLKPTEEEPEAPRKLKQSGWRVSAVPPSIKDEASEGTDFYPLVE